MLRKSPKQRNKAKRAKKNIETHAAGKKIATSVGRRRKLAEFSTGVDAADFTGFVGNKASPKKGVTVLPKPRTRSMLTLVNPARQEPIAGELAANGEEHPLPGPAEAAQDHPGPPGTM